MSELKLIRLPNGTGLDSRAIRGVYVIDRSDNYPGIQERVSIAIEDGNRELVEGFSSLQEAKAWAAKLMDEIDTLRQGGVTEYEYRIARHSDPDDMELALNIMAREGWRLVSTTFEGTRHVAYLERELPGGMAKG